jgi:DUF1365 family protein
MRKFSSALYHGAVVHRRLRPKQHKLRYSIFNILFDLDELPTLSRELRGFSHNRFNLFSFYDRDHGDGKLPLRGSIEAILQRHGVNIAGGPIRLLCMPRMLGFVFNPLSVYFCHRPSGELAATLYEVNNTFGERHYYLVPLSGNTERSQKVILQASSKPFHVSPFLPLDLVYRFRIATPAENAAVSVHVHDQQGLLVAASLSAKRKQLTNGALLRTFVTFPLLTLKVVAGIHWEALKLWLKGVKIHSKPKPPERQVTLGVEERYEAKGNVVAGATDRAA